MRYILTGLFAGKFGVLRIWFNYFECFDFRDLTMDNLLLGPEGQLMLTYFYRKEKFPNATTLTTMLRQDAVQRLYVAPERPLQAKSDFWSVGVILYEMLTRKSFQSCHPAGVFCYHEIQYPEDVILSEEAKELLDGVV